MTTPLEQLAMRRFLEVLDRVSAGLAADTVFDQVERTISRALTTCEREHLLCWMNAKGWLTSYRCPLTDRILYLISDAGRLAMIAL